MMASHCARQVMPSNCCRRMSALRATFTRSPSFTSTSFSCAQKSRMPTCTSLVSDFSPSALYMMLAWL